MIDHERILPTGSWNGTGQKTRFGGFFIGGWKVGVRRNSRRDNPHDFPAGTKKPACGRLLKDELGLFLANRARL